MRILRITAADRLGRVVDAAAGRVSDFSITPTSAGAGTEIKFV